MPVRRIQATLHVLALVAFEGVAVALLHRVGSGPHVGVSLRDLDSWLAVTPPDQVVMSVLWLIALALGWWALGSTLLYLAMRAMRFRAGVRVAARLAPPVVRRVVDRALAATLVTSALLGPAAPALAAERAPLVATQQVAAADEYDPEPAGPGGGGPARPAGPQRTAPDPVAPPPSRDDESEDGDGHGGPDGEQGGMSRADAEAAAAEANAAAVAAARAAESEAAAAEGGQPVASEPTASAAGEDDGADEDREAAEDEGDRDAAARDGTDAEGAERPTRRARARVGPVPGSTYTVRVGDHLWGIAAQVVAADGDGAGGRRAVASYWAELVRTAKPALRSGDPNLIYPGEQLHLPPLRPSED